MAPPEKRLDPLELEVTEVDHGLVVQLELIVSQRGVEIDGHLEPFCDRRLHLGKEAGSTVLLPRFGLVQRHVSVAE